MSEYFVHLEDPVVAQLFTSAIEAYEVIHKQTEKSKGQNGLETYGLLWGYRTARNDGRINCINAVMSTVETSAIRTRDSVLPDYDSMAKKKQFIEHYWPHLELVGTFHSHPYDSLDQVNALKGWRPSISGISSDEGGDDVAMTSFHKEITPEAKHLAHLVVTITGLAKRGWALPERLKGKEKNSGYVLTAENRKIWLKAFSTELTDNERKSYIFNETLNLDAPALQSRFLAF